MVNWLMKLIRESLTKKIHHFSLDFGSALLANIIHAQSTLTTLSQDSEYSHNVFLSNILVNVVNAQTIKREEHSGLHIDAFANMSLIFV